MYAVIETGGKQYKVVVGDKLKVEKLAADEGASVELRRVLMVADGENITLGPPLAETSVSATVLSHGRGVKIRVFKMKRRKDYRRTQGHRQAYTEIQITAIDGKPGTKVAAKAAADTKAITKVATKVDTKASTKAATKAATKADTKADTKAETTQAKNKASQKPPVDEVAKPVAETAQSHTPAPPQLIGNADGS